MKKITLSLNDDNLETLLTILNSLKEGLITSIEVDGKKKIATTQYKPKNSRVIYEEESGTNDSSGKYMNPMAYKQRLQKK